MIFELVQRILRFLSASQPQSIQNVFGVHDIESLTIEQIKGMSKNYQTLKSKAFESPIFKDWIVSHKEIRARK